jgi:hypothetical protein
MSAGSLAPTFRLEVLVNEDLNAVSAHGLTSAADRGVALRENRRLHRSREAELRGVPAAPKLVGGVPVVRRAPDEERWLGEVRAMRYADRDDHRVGRAGVDFREPPTRPEVGDQGPKS